jgi:YHS domain-containing protein
MSALCAVRASDTLHIAFFKGALSNHWAVLWLTPLFLVDYTRFIAREAAAHRPFDRFRWATASLDLVQRLKRHSRSGHGGRLGYGEPPESVRRVSLQERIDRWAGQGMAWLVRKVVAMLLRNVTPVSTPRPGGTQAAIPLHRDPWCGIHVSSEISFPLEQAGQVIYFCSTDCRTRYQKSSQRAASA